MKKIFKIIGLIIFNFIMLILIGIIGSGILLIEYLHEKFAG